MMLLQTVAAFILSLGVLIVVHEFGHYIAARLCDVKVLRFSVGFGRPLAVVRRGADRTEWVISAVPFGGYVKMLDEREGAVASEEIERSFNRKSVWRRIFIVAAGPAFNFLFAVLAYSGLYMYGLPEARPVLAEPDSGSLAAVAGFRSGDTVHLIDEQSIASWQDFRWRVLKGVLQKQKLKVEVQSNTQKVSVIILDLSALSGDAVENDLLERLGLRLYRPSLMPVLGNVVSGSAAATSGLKEGDLVTDADGRHIETWTDLVRVIRAKAGQPVRLGILRNGVSLVVHVTPEEVKSDGERIGRIGVAPYVPTEHTDRMFVRINYGPIESLVRSVEKTLDISLFSLKMLGRMLVGEVSWRHLSGPVTIADYAGQSAQLGWLAYINFLALISISLGVLNLLPIPLLDGGHLMYYAVEIMKGSPVSEKVMEFGQRAGLALLLTMMAFAFYNDINRLLSS